LIHVNRRPDDAIERVRSPSAILSAVVGFLPAVGVIAKIRNSDSEQGFSMAAVNHGSFRSDRHQRNIISGSRLTQIKACRLAPGYPYPTANATQRTKVNRMPSTLSQPSFRGGSGGGQVSNGKAAPAIAAKASAPAKAVGSCCHGERHSKADHPVKPAADYGTGPVSDNGRDRHPWTPAR
jgi:hypothetical protein